MYNISYFCNQTVEQTATPNTYIKKQMHRSWCWPLIETIIKWPQRATKFKMPQFLPLEIEGSHAVRQEANCAPSSEMGQKYHQRHRTPVLPLSALRYADDPKVFVLVFFLGFDFLGGRFSPGPPLMHAGKQVGIALRVGAAAEAAELSHLAALGPAGPAICLYSSCASSPFCCKATVPPIGRITATPHACPHAVRAHARTCVSVCACVRV